MTHLFEANRLSTGRDGSDSRTSRQLPASSVLLAQKTALGQSFAFGVLTDSIQYATDHSMTTPLKHPFLAMALHSLEQMPQRQDSLRDQLLDLHTVANKIGMYDAADLISKWLEQTEFNPPVRNGHD